MPVSFCLMPEKKRDGPYQFQNNWIPPGAIDIMSNFVFICFFFKIRSTYILLMVNQFQNCYNEFVIISLDLTVSLMFLMLNYHVKEQVHI